MLGRRGLQALLEAAGETGELNGGALTAALALGKSDIALGDGAAKDRAVSSRPLLHLTAHSM